MRIFSVHIETLINKRLMLCYTFKNLKKRLMFHVDGQGRVRVRTPGFKATKPLVSVSIWKTNLVLNLDPDDSTHLCGCF